MLTFYIVYLYICMHIYVSAYIKMYIYLIHAYWFFLFCYLINISITFIEISLEKWVCREKKKSKFFCVYTNGMVEKVAHPFRSKTNHFILNKQRANRPERMELQLYWLFRVNFSDILMYSHSSLHLMREKKKHISWNHIQE